MILGGMDTYSSACNYLDKRLTITKARKIKWENPLQMDFITVKKRNKERSKVWNMCAEKELHTFIQLPSGRYKMSELMEYLKVSK